MTEKKSPRKMKPGGGKAKGNQFESQIAKKLSAALPINFIRSPGSGARIGGKNFATLGAMMGEESMKLFNADVVPVNESTAGFNFNFSVECKFYKESDNFTSLVSGTANIYKWFRESIVDSAKIDRKPILIFKWNRTPVFVAVKHGSHKLIPTLTISQSDLQLDIFEFEDLLKYPDFWVTKHD